MKRVISISLLALFAFSAFALGQSDAEQKLVLKWTMRDSGGPVVEDLSGRNNFGLLRGAAFFKADSSMQNSVIITADNGLVSSPYSLDLEPAQGTVETWINVDVLRNADIFNMLSSRLVRSGIDGGRSVYGMHLNNDGSITGFVMNDDPGRPGSPWVSIRSRAALVQVGEWHLVTLRWDNQEVAVFLDGEMLGCEKYKQVPLIGLSYSGENEFSLGQATYWGGSDHGFLGQFGETRIYSRSLQNKEIRERFVSQRTK